MEGQDQNDDPVVHEIPVYLTQALADRLYLLQYPLRPAFMPYEGSAITSTRVKPNQGDIELDVAVETKGPHYSRSRGEQYARKAEGDGGVTHFKSGMMDQQTLSSTFQPVKSDSRYVAGVLKDGELHLTPLKAIVQLRPTLRHIELSDSSGGSKFPSGGQSDGDTTATESEEEEAKPVTVRFARGGVKQKNVQSEPEEEPWQTAVYHSMDSAEADEERKLLFGMVEDHTNVFTCSPQEYLNLVCPVGSNEQSSSPHGPSDVLSLTKLKTLPSEKQVTELMKKAMLLQFDRVCTILGRVKQQEREIVLDDLQRCAVLVQGCWVVHSSLVVGKELTQLRSARDYVLWCFKRNPVLSRKDLTSVLKITTPQLHDLLRPVAVFKAGSGWHFKQSTDDDFIAKYPSVVESQKIWWEKRHKEIVFALGIGVSPESAHTQSQGQGSASLISGQHVVAMASQKAKEMATPTRQHLLPPNQLIKTESASDVVSLDSIPIDAQESLKRIVIKTIGRSVANFEQIKKELITIVTNLPEDNSLWQQTVSDGMIVNILSLTGAVNIGEPHGKQVYAMKSVEGRSADEAKYRQIVLEFFSKVRSIKRKQLTDQITKLHEHCDSKLLTAVLKDLGQSKPGGIWFVKGLESD